MTNLTELSLEPFRGDFEGLEKMAHSSWRDEYGISSFPNFYRPAFLRYLFGRIKEKDHLPVPFFPLFPVGQPVFLDL